jgi:hypothetical protein
MAGDIVHERLSAEAEAWPFLSSQGFVLGAVALERLAPGVLAPATEAMARELEERLRLRGRGLSLTELRGVRDHAWFGEDPQGAQADGPTVYLGEYLRRLSDRYLEPAGAKVQLREAPLSSRAGTVSPFSAWRWISLLLPPDLLISACYAAGAQDPPESRVSLVGSQLAHMLNEPVAETHLHEKAAFSFAQLWTSWMGGFLRSAPKVSQSQLPPSEGWPFGSQTAFYSMLLAAAIVRLLMAGYLLRLTAGHKQSFAAFSREAVEHATSRHWHPLGRAECLHRCGAAMQMLLKGSKGPGLAELGHAYRLLVGRRNPSRPGSIEQIYSADPIAAWMPGVPGKVLPEALFSTRAQRAIRSGLADADFTRFFWQYQRVRCRANAFLILEPGTAGLDWFQRYFERLKGLRGDLDATLLDAALEHESADLHLGALELRRTPPQTWIEVCHDVQKLAEGGLAFHRRNQNRAGFQAPEIGVTYHFLKDRINTRHPQKRLHADPEGNGTGVRFGDWFAEQQRRSQAIAGALRRFPSMLVFIRGLDFASTELAVPAWATLGSLAEARRASVQAAWMLGARSDALPSREDVPALRVTYHVGEDFRRLVEGLRRIHELMDFGLIRQGDRIGHGVALGIDPRDWARNAGTAFQPAEERIDDLLWELERYQRGDFGSGSTRREQVRAELRRLIRETYLDPTPDLDMYLEARRLRHSPSLLERMGYPRRVSLGGSDPHPSDALEILRRYLTSTVWFRRGEQPIPVVHDDAEITMLHEAQRWLRRLLGRMEITVESNPSSNLLTSDLGTLGAHPALKLTLGASGARRQRSSSRLPEAPLLVSINTDDPITFATRLADEFAYLYSALLQSGYTAQEALTWIERVRNAGWRSRFTVPASANGRLIQQLSASWRKDLKAFGQKRRPKVDVLDVPVEETLGEAIPLEKARSLTGMGGMLWPMFHRQDFGTGNILGTMKPFTGTVLDTVRIWRSLGFSF